MRLGENEISNRTAENENLIRTGINNFLEAIGRPTPPDHQITHLGNSCVDQRLTAGWSPPKVVAGLQGDVGSAPLCLVACMPMLLVSVPSVYS